MLTEQQLQAMKERQQQMYYKGDKTEINIDVAVEIAKEDAPALIEEVERLQKTLLQISEYTSDQAIKNAVRNALEGERRE